MAEIKLSVIVPCYNEEKRFVKGFEHYYTYLKKQKYLWELIFVNDGSKDKTLRLIKNSIKNKKNVKVVSYPKNHGKGYAIVQGILNAKGKIVLFTDLDHAVPIATVETFFEHFEHGSKVVIGSRRIRGAKILVHQAPFREFLGRGFTLLVNVLIYPGILDATCGFKAFENKTAKQIFKKITIYDWAFDAEILYICRKNKIKFSQAPVVWTDKSGSKVSLKKDVLKSLKGLIKIRMNDINGTYR